MFIIAPEIKTKHKIGLFMDREKIVSHLGINPVRGGRPASERSIIGKINWMVGDWRITFLIVDLEFIDLELNNRKIGEIIIA